MLHVQVLSKMHHTPDQSVEFSFHWMEFPLSLSQALVAYVMTLSNFPSFCDSMAPTPLGDQSTSSQKVYLKSGRVSTGASTSVAFNAWYACSQPISHTNATSFFINSNKGLTKFE